MIKEAVEFIERYETGSKQKKSKERQIESIANDYDNVAIINVSMDNGSLKMDGEPILLTSNLDEELEECGFKVLRKWLNKSADEELLNKLNFRRYIRVFADIRKNNNKSIGSQNGLYSFSLFHIRVREAWISNQKQFKSRIHGFKLKEYVLEEIEKRHGEEVAELARKLNSEAGVRGIYHEFSEWLVENISRSFDLYIYLNLKDKAEQKLTQVKDIVETIFESYLLFKLSIHDPTRDPNIIKEGECPICGYKGKIAVPAPYNNLNRKLPFIKHLTRGEPYSIKICINCIKKLNRFDMFIKSNNIDFFPLFIGEKWKDEEVRYLKKRENGLSFFGILKHISNRAEEDKLDFILLHQRRDILYYDYISNYSLEFVRESESYLYHGGLNLGSKDKLNNEFVYSILGMRSNCFFGDINFPRGFDTHRRYLVHKYRKKLFNLIYRNKRTLRDGEMREIVTVLLDSRVRNGEARHPRNKNSKDRKLLDIYLNSDLFLNNPGELAKIRGGEKHMLEQIREERKNIIEEGKLDIDSDDKFGYYLGQITYYLIEQSEASNKMRLLKPIIECNSKESLERVVTEKYLDKYAYSLSDYKDFKHVVFAATFDYLQSNFNSTFDKVKVPFYVGFFDENIFQGGKSNE